MMDEDWTVLTTLFPTDWKELALSTGALKGLRKDKSADNLLRTLLIHLGCGYSLRETVVCAKQAGLADMSDVALYKRLKKSKEWLRVMCLSLLAERGSALTQTTGQPVRLFDATHVKEPGKTGSLWRVHYSVRAPSFHCDHFEITPTSGAGTGESFQQFPVEAGDLILADRGYSLAGGIEYAAANGAFITVRLNPNNVPVTTPAGEKFDLSGHLKGFKKTGEVRSWPVCVTTAEKPGVSGRICVIRKTAEAIRKSRRKLKRRASKNGQKLRDQTLVYAEYVMVFTTFPEEQYPAHAILEWYRLRWQIELVFKRFKQIAELGHLPKHDDDSAQAWLYGKLFIAMVTEKLIEHAVSISPWGYEIATPSPQESVA